MSKDEDKPKISETDAIYVRVAAAGSPTLDDIKMLHDMLKAGPLLRILHQILKESDSKLTTVGMGDLSNESVIKNLIKVQGEAIGLSRAVEYFIQFATATEEK